VADKKSRVGRTRDSQSERIDIAQYFTEQP